MAQALSKFILTVEHVLDWPLPLEIAPFTCEIWTSIRWLVVQHSGRTYGLWPPTFSCHALDL